MDVLERIKQYMEEREWSDYKLAKEANLSTSTVTNIFSRNTAPTLPTLEAICRAFGITLAQFFTEDEEPFALTSEQKELIIRWNTLGADQEKFLLDLIKIMQCR